MLNSQKQVLVDKKGNGNYDRPGILKGWNIAFVYPDKNTLLYRGVETVLNLDPLTKRAPTLHSNTVFYVKCGMGIVRESIKANVTYELDLLLMSGRDFLSAL